MLAPTLLHIFDPSSINQNANLQMSSIIVRPSNTNIVPQVNTLPNTIINNTNFSSIASPSLEIRESCQGTKIIWENFPTRIKPRIGSISDSSEIDRPVDSHVSASLLQSLSPCFSSDFVRPKPSNNVKANDSNSLLPKPAIKHITVTRSIYSPHQQLSFPNMNAQPSNLFTAFATADGKILFQPFNLSPTVLKKALCDQGITTNHKTIDNQNLENNFDAPTESLNSGHNNYNIDYENEKSDPNEICNKEKKNENEFQPVPNMPNMSSISSEQILIHSINKNHPQSNSLVPRSPPSSPMRLRSSELSSSKPNHLENHSENESDIIVRRESSLVLNHRHCHRRNKRHRCRHHRFKTSPVDGNLSEATGNIFKANDSKKNTYTCDDPLNWTCDDVHKFVSSVTDTHIADQFKIQEIDGLALSLLQSNPNDHLMMINIMKIKLGPMLRIINKFQHLKNKFQT